MPWEAIPGLQLGNYRVVSKIGQGGMAAVYLAEDLALGRQVALKTLKAELAEDQEFRSRFEREGKLSAALEHPNIVPVFDAGEAEGVFYIAMRFVEGVDLATLLQREETLDPDHAVAILSQVASALDFAHARGLVHRDVKPANILLAAGDGLSVGEHTYLSDFGLARHTLSLSALTRAGAFFGTLDYTPPEQIQGRGLDARTDVYALACAAYECLAGSPPFHRDTAVATMMAQMEEPAPALSAARRDLSDATDQVFYAGLAKPKEDRPATAGLFLHLLSEALGLEGAKASPQAFVVPLARLEERRLITVVSAELVTPDALTDPEDIHTAEARFAQIVADSVPPLGGTVERVVRSQALVVFGSPVAHEDDATLAVRAAHSIIDQARTIGASYDASAGVDTGRALVDLAAKPGDPKVWGAVIDRAAALAARARPGEVLGGDAVVRAARTAVEWEPAGGGDVAAHRAVDPHPDPSRASDAHLFVGRARELETLRGAWERAAVSDKPQLVTVTAEPGAGKTRLLSRFAEGLGDVSLREGRCLPHDERSAFAPLADIVRGEAAILDSDGEIERRVKIGAMLASLHADDLGAIASRLELLVGVHRGDQETAEQRENFEAWARFVELLVTDAPGPVVFDDLQWADDAMLDFIEYLTDQPLRGGLLLLCAARPELFARRATWGGGRRDSISLSLGSLADDDILQLIDTRSDNVRLDQETREILLERAGGNPLYAEEFARMCVDLDAHGREVPMPESLLSLIAARLDVLPTEQRLLLQDAAVVGRTFWPGAVAAITGADPGDIVQHLRELGRRELIRPERVSGPAHEQTFSFWHALVRDVAYDQIPRAPRGRKHAAVADWLRSATGDVIADHADELAYHYGTAFELGSWAEAEGLDELAANARAFEIVAGDRAMGLDIREAQRHYLRAFDLPGGERGALLTRLAEAAFASGETDVAVTRFEQAIAACQADGDEVGRAQASVRLATLRRRTEGDTAGSHELRVEMIRLLEAQPPGPELVAAYGELAGDREMAGFPEEAAGWAERGLSLAESLGLTRQSVGILRNRGAARLELGDVGGIEDLRESLDRALRLGLGPQTVDSYNNLADALQHVEGPGAALAIVEEGLVFAERRALEEGRLWLLATSLIPLYELDRWEDLLERGTEVIDRSAERGGAYLRAATVPPVALVHARQGRIEEARELIDGVVPSALEIGDPQILWLVLPVLVIVSRSGSNDEDVLTWLERLTSDAVLGLGWNRLPFLSTLLRSVPPDRIDALTIGLEPSFGRYVCIAKTMAALRARDRGEVGAPEGFVDAANAWKAFGSLIDAADCQAEADRSPDGTMG